jgi:hypothetical protein
MFQTTKNITPKKRNLLIALYQKKRNLLIASNNVRKEE